ncbi:MAG: hypothetical protein M1833_003505 [Piccolia ochrophora]|nr:MAG: hypothetical protein M1833_003505 [Piccolia ochrophora]
MVAEQQPHATPQDAKADHLCVLIHGLWGSPQHMAYLATALREEHSNSSLQVFVPKTNAGTHTYDGIDFGAERVTHEVEHKLRELQRDGVHIKKLSVVGYSLGGLVARYVVGLLDSRGWFENIDPINFTTFATPHLGVRTPRRGIYDSLFNAIGPRTLSRTGSQLFAMDDFQESGRPILALLADPESIFIRALARFKNRTLYANIVNDRTAIYYTTSISPIDPFADMNAVQPNYVKGYEPNIVDAQNPVTSVQQDPVALTIREVGTNIWSGVRGIPLVFFFVVIFPFGLAFFFAQAGIQYFRSRRRIRLHNEGHTGIGVGTYRIPLTVQGAVEGLFRNLEQTESQGYLPLSPTDSQNPQAGKRTDSSTPDGSSTSTRLASSPSRSPNPYSAPSSSPEFPTLALLPSQFDMIRNLNAVGFTKYPVHIHKVRHSHAAIIVRTTRFTFDEGKIVVRHWLENSFSI